MRCEFWAQPAEAALVAQRWSVECRGFESHLRQLIFLRKSDCLGCAVLLCLVVCLLLSSFLLSSLIKTCISIRVVLHFREGKINFLCAPLQP